MKDSERRKNQPNKKNQWKGLFVSAQWVNSTEYSENVNDSTKQSNNNAKKIQVS